MTRKLAKAAARVCAARSEGDRDDAFVMPSTKFEALAAELAREAFWYCKKDFRVQWKEAEALILSGWNPPK